MRSLTADDIIRFWEAGPRQDSAERAVAMLAAAFPDRSREDLLHLSLGQRNARLLDVRQRFFGPEIQGFAECQSCCERLEFTLSSDDIRDGGPVENSNAEFDLEAEGYVLRFRLLDTHDLRAVAAAVDVDVDVDAARKLLVERCLLQVRRGDEMMAIVELPERVIKQLAARLAECDPQADVLIDLACPACEFRWQIPFDIASFFYSEISIQAQRLMREVHMLARAYAWHEADILALSGRRRQYYLELLGQ